MQFFSIFDLLLSKAENQGMDLNELYLFFRGRKIKKADIEGLKQTSYIPSDENFKEAIYDFLNMSELEIELAMGRIPLAYRASYFENIKNIAALLEPEEIKKPDKSSTLHPYYENEYGQLYHGDCIEVMRSLPQECVDLVFADPPFNLNKSYDSGINDHLTMSQYINWTYQWLDECVRLLKPGGRIFVYNIPKWCTYIASYLAETLTFWAWIAVDMKFSFPIQNRLYPAHYGLVSFVKGRKANTFHNQRIPLQVCRHCGGELKDYGGYKNKMNVSGVNVSDVWTDIYPVRHKGDKNRKYNELSVKFMDRIIAMSTDEGDTVFDPFGGSGTTFAVAQLLKRKWIGCELGDCEIIKERLIHPESDLRQLQKKQEESEGLFPPKIVELRKKNGFWTCDDFQKFPEINKDEHKQISNPISLNLSFM